MTRALLLLLAVTACANPQRECPDPATYVCNCPSVAPPPLPGCRSQIAHHEGVGVPTRIDLSEDLHLYGFGVHSSCDQDSARHQWVCWSGGFRPVVECAVPADGGAK